MKIELMIVVRKKQKQKKTLQPARCHFWGLPASLLNLGMTFAFLYPLRGLKIFSWPSTGFLLLWVFNRMDMSPRAS